MCRYGTNVTEGPLAPDAAKWRDVCIEGWITFFNQRHHA
jgi:hypothetical protein